MPRNVSPSEYAGILAVLTNGCLEEGVVNWPMIGALRIESNGRTNHAKLFETMPQDVGAYCIDGVRCRGGSAAVFWHWTTLGDTNALVSKDYPREAESTIGNGDTVSGAGRD